MKNPWINYVQRSYELMRQAIIDKIKNPINGIPEITDHTPSNEFIKMVTIWSGMGEQLGYYVDNQARESFLITCRKYRSGVDHAKKMNYRIHGVAPSIGEVTFTLDNPAPSPVVIPAGTRLETPQGIQFRTLTEVTIDTSETHVNADVKQWTEVPQFVWGQSDGSQNLEVELEENVVDNSVFVLVAGNQIFTSQDTFAFSKPEDTHFVAGLNYDKKMVVQFGDGITGEIPQSAADIEIAYFTSLGREGNVPGASITEIIDAPTLPQGIQIEVSNENATNGGSDIESLTDLKKNIPLSIRTKMRAVTEQDYRDIATLAPGVAKADVEFDVTTGVFVYVVPSGGGIASSALLDAVEVFFDDKRMVTTQVGAKPVGEVRLQLQAIVNIQSGYNQADTVNAAKDNTLSLLSWENADIKGRLVIGDLYEAMETTVGVLNSQILDISIIPYAAASDPDSTPLNWTKTVLDAGTTVIQWKIQFVTATTYNFFKNNAFIDNYTVGDTITLPEIEFTINSDTYQINDIYIFNTYPKPDLNKGVIELNEFSIIVANSGDVQIEGNGGIT